MLTKNIKNLQKLSVLPYFTVPQLAGQLGLGHKSAGVFASRYAKAGILLKLKNNYYAIAQRWQTNTELEYFGVANILQVPSYLSLTTALAFYEITTQVQQSFFESVCLKRSIRYEAAGVVFNYFKLSNARYFDFIKKDGVFIATPEKAFLDCVYLFSFGKYKPDFRSMDLTKLNIARLKKIMRGYPAKTVRIAEKLCRI